MKLTEKRLERLAAKDTSDVLMLTEENWMAREILELRSQSRWVKKLVVAIEKADSHLYCEKSCTAADNDRNWCSCGRRDNFGAMLEVFNEYDQFIPAAPKEGENG